MSYCYICNKEMHLRWACRACVDQFHLGNADWDLFCDKRLEERYSQTDPIPAWVQEKYPWYPPELALDEGI